jgi:D-3-phosphoglycerate dehydrogenase
MPFRVLVTDFAWPSLSIEDEILSAVDAEILVAPTGARDELIALAAASNAILTNWATIPEEALEVASECRIISRYGVGLDNIPVGRATELGILVTNVPTFCVDEVSDHAMALLLACARRVVEFSNATRQGEWDLSSAPGLPRLRGQTLGLIGFGNIARALIPKAQAFGLSVIVYTPRLEPGPATGNAGVEQTNDLDRVLRKADYVSIHAPATAETRHLLGDHEFSRMKSSAYLINTARGSLVDETALFRALSEGRIRGAAIDVLEGEPPHPQHPLLALANVIVTPHTAFYSDTAIAELQTTAATNVAAALTGSIPATLINTSVLDNPLCRVRPT